MINIRNWTQSICCKNLNVINRDLCLLKCESNNSRNSATQISKQLHNLTIFQRFVALATISMPWGQKKDAPIPSLGLGRRGANHLTFGLFFNHFYSTAAPLIVFLKVMYLPVMNGKWFLTDWCRSLEYLTNFDPHQMRAITVEVLPCHTRWFM